MQTPSSSNSGGLERDPRAIDRGSAKLFLRSAHRPLVVCRLGRHFLAMSRLYCRRSVHDSQSGRAASERDLESQSNRHDCEVPFSPVPGAVLGVVHRAPSSASKQELLRLTVNGGSAEWSGHAAGTPRGVVLMGCTSRRESEFDRDGGALTFRDLARDPLDG